MRGHGTHKWRHLNDIGAHRGAIDGGTIWWVAPTYKVGRKIWRDLKRACRFATIDKSEQEQRIELVGSGSITVQSADNPEVLVGDGLDGVVIDESSITEEKVWKESIRPALSDKQGWAMLIGTPYRGQNWYYRMFIDAGTRKNWERWQRPSSDNPLNTPEEMAEARLDVGPRAFAQQFEAQFLEVEGALFPGNYFPDTIWFDEWPDGVQFTVLACDPSMGKTDKADYSAWVVLRLDPTTGIMYVDADLERRPPSEIVQRGLGLASQYVPQRIDIEANAFQAILASQFHDGMAKAGLALPIYPVVQVVNKETRIRGTLDKYLACGELRFRRTRGCRLLVEQLQTFPEGKFDDGPDALQMAIRAMQEVFYPLQDEAAA